LETAVKAFVFNKMLIFVLPTTKFSASTAN